MNRRRSIARSTIARVELAQPDDSGVLPAASRAPLAPRSQRLAQGPFPMWVFDSVTGAILAANEAALAVYGYGEEEMMELTVDDLCSAVGWWAAGATVHEDESSPRWIGARTQHRKDGSTFESELGLLGADYEMTVLVAVRHHDTLPPDDDEPTQTAERPTLRARLERHGKHGKTLLGRPRTLGYVPQPVQTIDVDPMVLVSEIVAKMRPRAEAKDIELLVHCGCASVRVDPGSFSEALCQLLDNAIDATRGAAVALVVQQGPDGDFEWRVQDGGRGMRAEVLGRLGTPFHGARPGREGLGVIRAWDAIERHGGLMHFESTPGAGTTVTIWLPRPW